MADSNLGKFIVITGPSGAGKDSVIERAREMGLDFAMAITTTTRSMRPGEAEGNPYYFVSEDHFQEMVDHGEMIEWAHVYGNNYGCTKAEVERARKENDVVIVRVDIQGARTYKEMVPDAITVFIEPRDYSVLERRLRERNTDTEEVIAQRMKIAHEEMKDLNQWDYRLLNEDDCLDATVQKLIEIANE